jgi:hypothetical protein
MVILQEEVFLRLMQLNKNIKIFLNYVIGPLLFIGLSWSLYRQVSHQPHLETSWNHITSEWGSSRILLLLSAMLLMLVNWGLESLKWKAAVADIHRFTFLQAFKAVLSGVSFSVVMPNRVGEYLGRMMHMPEGKRLKVVTAAIVCSCSQVLITLISGALGLIFLRSQLISSGFMDPLAYQWATGILMGVSLILTIFYFNIGLLERLVEQIFRKRTWFYLVEVIRGFSVQRLGYLLGLSFARYLVFVLQYILIFSLFGVNVSPPTLLWVMSLVFLSLAVIPTIALAEIGIRGEIMLKLVGIFSGNSLGIVLAAVVVWIINLILPALAGALFMLQIRMFRTRAADKRKM